MIHFVLLGRLPPRRCLDAGTAEPQYLLYSDKIRRAGACAGGRATSGKSPRSAESQSSVSSSSLRGKTADEELQFLRILETSNIPNCTFHKQ